MVRLESAVLLPLLVAALCWTGCSAQSDTNCTSPKSCMQKAMDKHKDKLKFTKYVNGKRVVYGQGYSAGVWHFQYWCDSFQVPKLSGLKLRELNLTRAGQDKTSIELKVFWPGSPRLELRMNVAIKKCNGSLYCDRQIVQGLSNVTFPDATYTLLYSFGTSKHTQPNPSSVEGTITFKRLDYKVSDLSPTGKYFFFIEKIRATQKLKEMYGKWMQDLSKEIDEWLQKHVFPTFSQKLAGFGFGSASASARNNGI